MFSQVSVCPHGVGGCPGPGGCLPMGCVQAQAQVEEGVQAQAQIQGESCVLACTEADPPPPADSYCCGRYASYWNAFLF